MVQNTTRWGREDCVEMQNISEKNWGYPKTCVKIKRGITIIEWYYEYKHWMFLKKMQHKCNFRIGNVYFSLIMLDTRTENFLCWWAADYRGMNWKSPLDRGMMVWFINTERSWNHYEESEGVSYFRNFHKHRSPSWWASKKACPLEVVGEKNAEEKSIPFTLYPLYTSLASCAPTNLPREMW